MRVGCVLGPGDHGESWKAVSGVRRDDFEHRWRNAYATGRGEWRPQEVSIGGGPCQPREGHIEGCDDGPVLKSCRRCCQFLFSSLLDHRVPLLPSFPLPFPLFVCAGRVVYLVYLHAISYSGAPGLPHNQLLLWFFETSCTQLVQVRFNLLRFDISNEPLRANVPF